MDNALVVPLSLSTEEAFEKFLRLSVADGAAGPRTVQAYRAGLTVFLAWCDGKMDPRAASFEDIQSYRSFLVANGLKRATIKLRLVAVRALYVALQRWGVRPDNPAAGVRAPKEPEAASDGVLRKALSPDETLALLKALPGSWAPQDIRDATMVRLMVFHGLRAGEVAALSVRDVDFETFSTLRLIGKGNKPRTIVLCGETRKDLIAWTNAAWPEGAGTGNPLFFGFDKPGANRLTVRSVERIVDVYLRKSGLKKAGRSAHALRHTAALLAVLGGAKREAIADAFGHASAVTTDIYIRAAGKFQDNPADGVTRALEIK